MFIAKHTPKQCYGLAIVTLTSGITGCILLCSIIAITIEYHFTEQQIVDFAWRIPFIVSGLFGFIAVYLLRFLQKIPIFKELAAQRELCNELPVKTILTSHKQACLITALLTWSLSNLIIVIILMTPDVILRGIYHIDRNSALQANCLAVFMLTVDCIFLGYLSDKIGSRLTMLVAYSGLIISASYFYSNSILSPATSFLTLSSYYGIIRRCRRFNPDYWHSCIPTCNSFFWSAFCLQYRLCNFWRFNADHHWLLATTISSGACLLC